MRYPRFASARSISIVVIAAVATGCACTGARTDLSLPRDGGVADDAADVPLPDAGTAPDAAETDTECDDGNECTDDVIEGGRCVHRSVADGTSCEDGRFCTMGDRCLAGVCASGDESVGPAEVLGRLHTFGMDDGVAVPLGDDRLAFIDPAAGGYATLVRVGDEIEVLDRARLGAWFSDESDIVRASLGSDRFAYARASADATPQVFVAGVSGDERLEDSARFAVPGSRIYRLAGTRERLWVCAAVTELRSVALLAYDLGAPGGPVESARVALDGPCRTLAISDDGARLYVGSPSGGLRWVDAASDPPVLRDVLSRSAEAKVDGELLVVLEPTRAWVLRESDHAELASIEGTFEAAVPSDGLVWTQRRTTTDTPGERILAVHDPLAPGGPRAISEQVVEREVFAGPRALAVAGRFAVRGTRPRIYELALGAIRERRHAANGSLSFVDGRGDEAHARSAASAHRIDVSDPRAPRFLGGGMHHADPALTFEESSPRRLWPARVPSLGDPALVDLTWTARARRRSFDDDALPRELGTVELPPGPTLARVVDGHFYGVELTSAPAHTARLTRARLADLEAGRTEPRSSWSLAPRIPGSSERRPADTVVFAVDPRARRAAVVVSSLPDLAAPAFGRLYWVGLDDGVIEEEVLDEWVRGIAISGDRAALVTSGDLVFRERGRGEVSRASFGRDAVGFVLAFDGEQAYVSSITANVRVVPFGAATIEGVPSFAMSELPVSMSTARSALLVGSANELLTLRPACE